MQFFYRIVKLNGNLFVITDILSFNLLVIDPLA